MPSTGADGRGSRPPAATRNRRYVVVAALAMATLVAASLSLGLGLLGGSPDDSHDVVAAAVVDDAIAAVLPAAVTLFVLALVTFVLEAAAPRPPAHRPVAARDRSPPSTIDI